MATTLDLASRGKRILIVDDSRDTTEALALLLRIQGFEVERAHSLEEARQRMGPFDVLIADVHLPDGSGLELMRDLGGKARGITMSGLGERADIERSHAAGFQVHLVKPVPIEQLLAAIRAA